MKPTRAIRLLPLLLLAGCAHQSFATVTLASEQSLISVGDRFVQTAALMKDLAAKGAVTPQQYGAWQDFAKYFKLTYGPLCDAWDAASTAGDLAVAGKIYDAVMDLVARLGVFYADAQALAAAFKEPT